MTRTFLKSKLHRVTVTDANLNYEGSLSIDENLMEQAGILPLEKVDVVNINTGDRFSTYVIKGKRGSGEISLNGGAARKGEIGDLLIIITYAQADESELSEYKAKTILVDAKNTVKKILTQSIL
ncbi:MAG TPA: aspartate 1-decarboxylase [Caldithrix abyssi]|uniref:Aspartate 1-decarboxylase n=1 Tax=Caldithrix abyssi TaxID=187145 RepID=A0A7V4UCI2_CALAY|nr:aspartate 1-decarboxylase [Caldithrix abyssi]